MDTEPDVLDDSDDERPQHIPLGGLRTPQASAQAGLMYFPSLSTYRANSEVIELNEDPMLRSTTAATEELVHITAEPNANLNAYENDHEHEEEKESGTNAKKKLNMDDKLKGEEPDYVELLQKYNQVSWGRQGVD